MRMLQRFGLGKRSLRQRHNGSRRLNLEILEAKTVFSTMVDVVDVTATSPRAASEVILSHEYDEWPDSRAKPVPLATLPILRPRVVGGEPAQHEWPSVASIQDDFGHSCGGSLIASDLVLTAAHCIFGESPRNLSVVLGRHDLSTNDGERIDIAEIIVHPNYDDWTFDSDIAIVRLVRPTPRQPVEYASPSHAQFFAPSVDAAVVGWGALSEGGYGSDSLREVTVPIVSNAVANAPESYDGQVTGNMLAAGYAEGGKDSCQGDSGGPLMVTGGQGQSLLVGVVSWGYGCGRPAYYGIYTRVANFSSWIDAVLPNSTGTIEFGRPQYTIGDVVDISVRDYDLLGQGVLSVQAASGRGDAEWIELTEGANGVFHSSISLTANPVIADDGILETRPSDRLTATYADNHTGQGVSTTVFDTVWVVADDHGNGVDTASPLFVGHSIPGMIEVAWDVDWFSFQAEAGKMYDFSTRLAGSSLHDSVLTLYDQDGSFIAFDDDGGIGYASQIWWQAPEDGTYYLEVAGYGDAVGDYDVAIRVFVEGDINLDGKVDARDLNLLALNWHSTASYGWENGDFDGNGAADAADLNAMALNWQTESRS